MLRFVLAIVLLTLGAGFLADWNRRYNVRAIPIQGGMGMDCTHPRYLGLDRWVRCWLTPRLKP